MQPSPKTQFVQMVAELQQPAASRLLVVEGLPAARTQLVSALSAHLGRKLLSVAPGQDWKKLVAAMPAANQQGAILFFDEAGTLFGKRSDVRDSHDRCADVETSFQGLIVFGVTTSDALTPALKRSAKTVVASHHP